MRGVETSIDSQHLTALAQKRTGVAVLALLFEVNAAPRLSKALRSSGRSNMTTIRYATNDEKIACARTLTGLDHHTVRFHHSGHWQSGSTKPDVRLVEVWRKHNHHVPFVHPSRNPFFWVSGPDAEDQKELWDSLTAAEIMQTMRSGYEAQRSHNVIKRKGIKHPKSAATPA
jgi:hypothetical protein